MIFNQNKQTKQNKTLSIQPIRRNCRNTFGHTGDQFGRLGRRHRTGTTNRLSSVQYRMAGSIDVRHAHLRQWRQRQRLEHSGSVGQRRHWIHLLYLRHFPQIDHTSHFQGIDHRLTIGLFGQWLLPFQHHHHQQQQQQQQQRWHFPYLQKGLCTASDGHWC
ncbi:hypothetical protein T10_11224 [Trichinella papuae]|uniref:Uncharacterized protein n=1 Tax=Trichinella papuae TaxID=268474 RepID=A0A0V1M878_9BILA|nr:hypothetical protein T10_11224 [Trichinella papuae]